MRPTRSGRDTCLSDFFSLITEGSEYLMNEDEAILRSEGITMDEDTSKHQRPGAQRNSNDQILKIEGRRRKR
jgi:hypothetical protein